MSEPSVADPASPPIFTRIVRPAPVVAEIEELSTELQGCHVRVQRQGGQSAQVTITMPSASGKAIHVSCFPPFVADLDTLAADLPALLTAIAAGLRAEGLDDLRSTWDQQFYGPRVALAVEPVKDVVLADRRSVEGVAS